MKHDIKKKWVEALRSGDYVQASGQLKNEDAFCCLGVLCDLWIKEEDGSWGYGLDHTVPPGRAMLIGGVVDWSGCAGNPFVDFNSDRRSLAGLNDQGETFETIATLIEEQL